MSSPVSGGGGDRKSTITRAKASPVDAAARKKNAGGGVPLAGRSPPRFQIPVHVLVWSLMLTPVAAYYVYYQKNKKSDDEIMETLSKDVFYQERIQANQRSRQDFQKFFDTMKDDNNSQEMNKKMSEMLSAGKSGGTGAHQENNAARKRLYAVDETLLGTEEGARLSAENLEHAKEKQAHIKQREKESRLNKKKKKKKKKDDQTKEANPNIPTSDATNINIQAQVDSTTVKTAAAAVIATGTVVAVVASVLFGGGRSSR